MLSIKDFSNKELVKLLCEFIRSENCDYNTYEELANCIESGNWLKFYDELLEDEQ